MSSATDMEEYYKRIIQLQEKLRRSEEERLQLEMKFNEMLQIMKEEEEVHFKKLRNKYKQFLEEDRRRQQRNDKILEALDRIENRSLAWEAKTEKFKKVRRRYYDYLKYSIPPRIDNLRDTYDDMLSDPIDHQTYLNKPYGDLQTKKLPETRYSNLGNINSMYAPKNSENLDSEKNTKDLQNSLRQNSGTLGGEASDNYKGYTEPLNEFSYNAIKSGPIETPSDRVHNELERILKQHKEEYKPQIQGFDTLRNEHTQPRVEKEISNNNYSLPQKCGTTGNNEMGIINSSFKTQREPNQGNVLAGVKDNDLQIANGKLFNNNVLASTNDFVEHESVVEEINDKKLITVEKATSSMQQLDERSQPKEIIHETDFHKSALVENQLKPNDDNQLLSQSTHHNQIQSDKPDLIIDNTSHLSTIEDPPIDVDLFQSSTNEVTITQENQDHITMESVEEPLNTNQDEKPAIQQENLLPNVLHNELNQDNEPLQSPHETDTIQSQLSQDFNQPDQYGQNLQQYNEDPQVIQQYEETNQQVQQFDENGQLLQYDTNEQPYDENGQLIQQYGETEQPLQYDENGQIIPQYDENGQAIQYDENGQPLEYDENGQLLQYDQNQSYLQYDENGQPLPQYDENGQIMVHYDENGQPLQYYDENGQAIQYYGSQQYDEQGQPIEQPYVEEPYQEVEQQPQEIKSNVLDLLETDTESTKQDTKVSNDSDFDLSNN